MNHNQIKGSLLEYLVRQLLINCGFGSVKPDGHYVYQQKGNGLFFINGKGAAHDADVLMDPPVQFPFFYPSQILFECKSYKRGAGIGTMRNALGLRYDINEFEIITEDSIRRRRQNKRATYAISNRKRYVYQVGVATIEKFNASAIEFATNNKIPILSLRWILEDNVCDLFHQIDENYISSLSNMLNVKLYSYLKNKINETVNDDNNVEIETFIRSDDIIGQIIRSFRNVINSIFVGLIESGDLIFLRQIGSMHNEIFRNNERPSILSAQIHYYKEEPNIWFLSLRDMYGDSSAELKFFIPERILSLWREDSLNRRSALQLKQNFFSRIYIFNGNRDTVNSLPFITVRIDRDWIDNAFGEL